MSGVALGTFLISIHWIEISSSMIVMLALEKTRTFTSLQKLAPEASASTHSATKALMEGGI